MVRYCSMYGNSLLPFTGRSFAAVEFSVLRGKEQRLVILRFTEFGKSVLETKRPCDPDK